MKYGEQFEKESVPQWSLRTFKPWLHANSYMIPNASLDTEWLIINAPAHVHGIR